MQNITTLSQRLELTPVPPGARNTPIVVEAVELILECVTILSRMRLHVGSASGTGEMNLYSIRAAGKATHRLYRAMLKRLV